MFWNARSFNSDLNAWDVSSVANMVVRAAAPRHTAASTCTHAATAYAAAAALSAPAQSSYPIMRVCPIRHMPPPRRPMPRLDERGDHEGPSPPLAVHVLRSDVLQRRPDCLERELRDQHGGACCHTTPHRVIHVHTCGNCKRRRRCCLRSCAVILSYHARMPYPTHGDNTPTHAAAGRTRRP